MLTYQFDLISKGDRRACLCLTECASDRDAVSRALAMLSMPFTRVKVWRGDVMIHEQTRSNLPN